MATSFLRNAQMSVLSIGMSLAIGGCANRANVPRAAIDRGYPSKAELEGVLKTPLPPREEPLKKGRTVEEWELAGPFPERAGSVPFAGDDPLVRRVAEQIARQRHDVVVTESMQCYAREIGRFVARYGDLPEDDLQAFAAGRCGVLPTAPALLYSLPSEDVSDEVAFKLVDDALTSVPTRSEFGIWRGSEGDRHVLLAAFGPPKVRLMSIEPIAESGSSVRIRGTLLDPAAWLRAYTGEGSLGFHACQPTRKVIAVLPDFDVTCKVASDDPYAVFDLLVAAPHSLLGRQVLTLVLSTGRPAPSRFRRLTIYDVPSTGSLLEQFNAVRAKLGHGPLQEVPAQSGTAHALIPHYFAAAAKHDLANMDFITLGMMAGWDVPGALRDSQFLAFRGASHEGAASFLGQLLFFPENRAVLLDADAEHVALATWQDEKNKNTWGILTTYSTFQPRNYPEVETALVDELDRQRQARGKGPVLRADTRVTQGILDHVMDKLAEGDVTPLGGLQLAMRTLSRRTQRSFTGQAAYALTLDGWRPIFEAGLVEDESVAVISKVGFFAAPGDHWGQYVSYFIYGPTFEVNRGSTIPKRGTR